MYLLFINIHVGLDPSDRNVHILSSRVITGFTVHARCDPVTGPIAVEFS